MSTTLVHFAGHLSFGLTAFSFYVRDILLLRFLAILSGIVGVFYSFHIAGDPLWVTITWLTVFIAINAVRIVNTLMERRRVSFSDEERELYETLFRQFTPVEFMKLMRLGEWRSAVPQETLAEEGKVLPELKLVYNGEVAIERDGREVARARDGMLIGEISYLRGGAATATVKAARPTRYVAWPREELRKLLRRNPTMDIAMHGVFSMDLTRKLGAAEGGGDEGDGGA